MKMSEGDKFKHKLTGRLYEVRIIREDTFILESEETPYRMWFGETDLKLFFEMAEKRESS
jgi:hypothetical protein